MDLTDQKHLETAAAPVLALSRHPLAPAKDRELFYAAFLKGETLEGYLKRNGILERMARQPYALTIDGRKLPRSLWHVCRPRPGTLINLHPLVRGGGGQNGEQKNPMATIAMIALIIAAPELAPGLAGATGLSVGAAQGLILVGGALAINKIFPPPKPQLPSDGKGSPTYDIAGGQNRARRYEPMPRIYGEHRCFPDLGAQTYTEFEGEDRVLFQVFDAGYNPDVVCSDFKLGDTPIANFTGLQLQESDVDGALTLFPGNVDTVAGAPMPASAGWIQRTTSVNTTSIAVELAGLLFNIQPNGTLTSAFSRIGIEYRLVGTPGWTQVNYQSDTAAQVTQTPILIPLGGVRAPAGTIGSGAPAAGEITLVGASRKPLLRTFRWDVAPGQYDVRVRRVTPDSTSETMVQELTWSQLRSYQPDTANYTGRKRFALKIRANAGISGQVEQFNFFAQQKEEVWNGAAWVKQITANPAWQVRSFLKGYSVGGRRKWGCGLNDAEIDVEGLKVWGAQCDAATLKFNFIFDQRVSNWDMYSALALGGRATPSWATGKWGIVYDAPNQAYTSVFGMHNIKAGSFEIEYANEDLAGVIEGWFVNKDKGWIRDFVRKAVPGSTSTEVRRVELVGVTDEARAKRETNLYANNNAYRTRRYKWRTDWEGVPCSRGDVSLLSHDLAALDYSGRFVAGGSAASLKLPRKVPLYGPGAFIVITKPDGTSAVYNVNGGAGDVDTLVPTVALPFNPWADPDGYQAHDYRWTYGPAATPAKKVKIEKFMPGGPGEVAIHAIDENPLFYDDTGAATSTGNMPVFGRAPTLQNLVLTDSGVRTGPLELVRVSIDWQVSGNFSFADVHYAINDGALQRLEVETTATSSYVDVIDGDKLFVQVTAYGDMGRLGQKAVVSTTKTFLFPIEGTRVQPLMPDVSGLELVGQASNGQGLDTVWKGKHAKFQWRAAAISDSWDMGSEPFGGASGARDRWFQDYRVIVYNVDANGQPVSVRREEPRGAVIDNRYEYSYEKNVEDGAGVPARNFGIGVWTRGRQNQVSKYRAFISVSNPQPAPPIGILVLAGANVIAVRCTPSSDTDVAGLKIHRSTVAGFAPLLANEVYDGPDAGFTFTGLAERTPYYFRLGFYDVFDKTNINYAGEVNATTNFTVGAIEVLAALPAAGNLGRVVFLTTDKKLYRDNGVSWDRTTDGADLLANTVTAAKINVATLDAITANMGNLTAGTITLNLGGHIKGGQSSWNVGTGYFLGFESGAYCFSIGSPTGNRITFNSSTGQIIFRGVLDASDITVGQLTGSQIGNGQIGVNHHAAGTRPFEILGSLPAAGNEGRLVYLTTDDKVYRDNGSAWILAIDGADITPGTVPASKLSVTQLSAITANLGAITAGTITLDTSGFIKGGQSAYDTGTGFWFGFTGGAWKFSFGSATKGFTWDGSVFSVRGDVIATGNIQALAITTPLINNNAVTIPTVAYSASGVTLPQNTATQVQTLTFTSSGAAVLVTFACEIVNSGGTDVWIGYDLKRNGTSVRAQNNFPIPYASSSVTMFVFHYAETPGAGSQTYSVEITTLAAPGAGYSLVGQRTVLTALECKK